MIKAQHFVRSLFDMIWGGEGLTKGMSSLAVRNCEMIDERIKKCRCFVDDVNSKGMVFNEISKSEILFASTVQKRRERRQNVKSRIFLWFTGTDDDKELNDRAENCEEKL
jgi:hypothetical protein